LKSRLRREWLHARDQIPEETRQAASRQIASRLCRSVWYDWAECVLTYLSFRSEVDTRLLIEQVWQDGKKVLAPKVDRNRETMEFYEIHQWEDLATGPWGIPEPCGNTMPYADACCRCRVLLLVPGVAFDRRGFRIGYGGGYYDRFLMQSSLMRSKKRLISVGLSFECQMVPEIPVEKHDLPVDGVLTEAGWKKLPPMPETLSK